MSIANSNFEEWTAENHSYNLDEFKFSFEKTPQILSINTAADLAIARNLHVRITGAADSATGSPQKNAAIALARAEHVASLMKKRGVPEERIEVVSEGGTAAFEPVSANRNCRIELFMQ